MPMANAWEVIPLFLTLPVLDSGVGLMASTVGSELKGHGFDSCSPNYFSREPAILKFVGCQPTKKNWRINWIILAMLI